MTDEATEEMDRRETQDRLVKLRTALAEVDAERGRLDDWQNEIAVLVPEVYEGSEGSQESCIEAWINDLVTVATPLAVELRAADESGEPYGDGEITIPIPADDLERERLFGAAGRLASQGELPSPSEVRVPVANPAIAALRALSDLLIERRDRLGANSSPKQDGRRSGLEEAAGWARRAADEIEQGNAS